MLDFVGNCGAGFDFVWESVQFRQEKCQFKSVQKASRVSVKNFSHFAQPLIPILLFLIYYDVIYPRIYIYGGNNNALTRRRSKTDCDFLIIILKYKSILLSQSCFTLSNALIS
ncbi:hypothetical protein [Tomelloso virus]|uniref:Uncharacterized protein n=1 Tax=Tomelloso virus TaxID=2053981 RepID=A0A2H4T2Z1_9VIRU|nr:hypothetical protein [Tomelloso virus]ATY70260.1 hypothetical protein [Tomelloso virus]